MQSADTRICLSDKDLYPELEDDPGFLDNNIGGFAQAADGTRAVIEFMHNWPIPLGYETSVPVLCDISSNPSYDVYISDASAMQVPVRMVAGMEGREFTLTVANEGPDAALGRIGPVTVKS